MHLEYDLNKNQRSIDGCSLSFEMVAYFDFDTALIWQDARKIYPEIRYSSLGFIDELLYALVFCETELGIRVIGFRRANQRERKKYDQSLQS